MRVASKVLISSLFLYIFLSMYGIWTFTSELEIDHADAALVLGTKVEGDQPSLALRVRIDYAIWLYEEGFVKQIVFTGGKTDGASLSEAEVSKAYAMEMGIPESAIVVEDTSQVTRENMMYTKDLAAQLGLENFLLVSDPFHMKRALMMADVFELNVSAAPTPTSVYTSWAEQFPFVLRETLAYVGNQLTFHQSF